MSVTEKVDCMQFGWLYYAKEEIVTQRTKQKSIDTALQLSMTTTNVETLTYVRSIFSNRDNNSIINNLKISNRFHLYEERLLVWIKF